MADNELQAVADSVVRRAQRLGFVVPRDIRQELTQAGLPDERWKDVVKLIRDSLHCRQGRYYHIKAVSPRLQQELTQQRQIQRAIRRLVRHHRGGTKAKERRLQDRVDFIQPVQVRAEDGKSFTLLSRDVSPTGIRLVGTRRLLGQKVHVALPQGEDAEPCMLLVRILWTCAIGDELFENGGTFLGVIEK
jgi:hypothetical protein